MCRSWSVQRALQDFQPGLPPTVLLIETFANIDDPVKHVCTTCEDHSYHPEQMHRCLCTDLSVTYDISTVCSGSRHAMQGMSFSLHAESDTKVFKWSTLQYPHTIVPSSHVNVSGADGCAVRR